MLEYFYRQRFKNEANLLTGTSSFWVVQEIVNLQINLFGKKNFLLLPQPVLSLINSNFFESLIHWNLLQNCKVIRALLSVSVRKIPLVKIKLVPLKTVNKFITSEGWKCIKVHKNGSKKWKLKKLQTLAFCSLQNELFSKFHTEHGALFFIH